MNQEEDSLGHYSIDQSLYDYIRITLPEGSTILELGSGFGTSLLAKHYVMTSVEHDEQFLGKYDSTYLHVPLKEHKAIKNHPTTRWYDADKLRPKLEGLQYDMLLVDGPPQTRSGFWKYFSMFDSKAIIVFDDLQRECERKLINSISSKLNCPYVVYGNGEGKPFGVINEPIFRT